MVAFEKQDCYKSFHMDYSKKTYVSPMNYRNILSIL